MDRPDITRIQKFRGIVWSDVQDLIDYISHIEDGDGEATALKPCPFCGGKGLLTYPDGDHIWDDGAFIRCADCSMYTDDYGTAGEAIAAWNRRV